jgi:UDP-N-acetylglucosamine 2-epimerase (non-hydrolysing)
MRETPNQPFQLSFNVPVELCRVVSVIGTRPEAIKMAPVIRELQRRPLHFQQAVISTGQHRELLRQALSLFHIDPDVNLELMQENQGLPNFASRALTSLSENLARLRPDVVLVQGDTMTVMAAAMAAFYQTIPVGHIEAGLRSFDYRNPFPEEMNRRLTSCLASLHFAPTERARQNLLSEGVRDERVFVTGNTIVDALQSVPLGDRFESSEISDIDFDLRRVLLVTAHRRESHGAALRSILRALKKLVQNFQNLEILFPVHPNPNVAERVRQELNGLPRVHIVDPLAYRDLLRVMQRCWLILTDSGGIQEEAPSFHKPVLILREVTERPEVVEAGAGKLIGIDSGRIMQEVVALMQSPIDYQKMCEAQNPFGDGHAAERIVDILAKWFLSVDHPPFLESTLSLAELSRSVVQPEFPI